MKLLLAAIVATVTLAASATFSAPPGTPRADVLTSEISLGELTRADGAHGRFEIRNAGDAELRILSAEPSCGCTVVSYDRSIAPGQIGHVDVDIDIATLRGSVWSQIHVETNDPERAELLLGVKARVVGAVLVLPAEDVFLYNRVGHLAAARVLLHKNADEPGELEIEGLRPSVAWLAVSAERLDAARGAGDGLPEAEPGDWVLEIAIQGEPAYGRREEAVRFATGLSQEPEVVIPVVLDLRPPVILATSELSLTPQAPTETVVLAVREGIHPSLLRAEAEPEALEFELESAGGRYFKLHVTGSDALAGQTAAIVFHVGLETMRLPVEWRTDGRPPTP